MRREVHPGGINSWTMYRDKNPIMEPVRSFADHTAICIGVCSLPLG